MASEKSFDEFLSEILTDYQGQDPEIDVSPATLTFIKSACIASAIWALKHQQNQIARSPFPDICDLDDLLHHAAIKGLQNASSYIDSDGSIGRLQSEVLDRYQNPGGGGNKFDWPRWAKDSFYDNGTIIERCTDARLFENKRSVGSVDIVCKSDRNETGFEQEVSSGLLDAISIKIESERSPGVGSDFKVYSAVKVYQTISLIIVSAKIKETSELCELIRSDIVDYIKSIRICDTLHVAQLESRILNYGVNIQSNSMTDNFVPAAGPYVYERAWPDPEGVEIYVAD